MQMCSSFSKLRFAQFASAAVLALAWHVAGAAAQLTPPAPETMSGPLIVWSAGEEQPSAAPSGSVRQDRSVSQAVYNETEPQAEQAAGEEGGRGVSATGPPPACRLPVAAAHLCGPAVVVSSAALESCSLRYLSSRFHSRLG